MPSAGTTTEGFGTKLLAGAGFGTVTGALLLGRLGRFGRGGNLAAAAAIGLIAGAGVGLVAHMARPSGAASPVPNAGTYRGSRMVKEQVGTEQRTRTTIEDRRRIEVRDPLGGRLGSLTEQVPKDETYEVPVHGHVLRPVSGTFGLSEYSPDGKTYASVEAAVAEAHRAGGSEIAVTRTPQGYQLRYVNADGSLGDARITDPSVVGVISLGSRTPEGVFRGGIGPATTNAERAAMERLPRRPA